MTAPPSGRGDFNQAQPASLDLHRAAQTLVIAWADGTKSVYPAAFLRKHCPCAACRTEREKQSQTALPILSAAPSGTPQLVGGNVVGNYALQLTWSDGHSSGIYDFRLLRALHDQLPI